MRSLTVFLAAVVAVSLPAAPSAQSDLDRLMEAVLSRRDDNWKKLQQYTLTEDNTFRVLGPMETPFFGSKREYVWLPREGFFVRSPVSADGVAISEVERRKAEDAWLKREQLRETRRTARRGGTPGAPDAPADAGEPVDIPDALRQSLEPEFVSTAYFLKFKFERGHYAFVGRERLLDRDVLRIEYYPEKLFQDEPREGRRGNAGDKPPTPQEKARREKGEQIGRQMNKVSFVTLWVEPTERQILQYEFQNIDADFLPARWMLRLDELHASMRMGTPFPGVWLPASLGIRVDMTIAVGRFSAVFDTKYRDYRLAETDSRVIIP